MSLSDTQKEVLLDALAGGGVVEYDKMYRRITPKVKPGLKPAIAGLCALGLAEACTVTRAWWKDIEWSRLRTLPHTTYEVRLTPQGHDVARSLA